MDPNCEIIENLLKNTGLSCDDLLFKLQQYRTFRSKQDDTTLQKEARHESVIIDAAERVELNSGEGVSADTTKEAINTKIAEDDVEMTKLNRPKPDANKDKNEVSCCDDEEAESENKFEVSMDNNDDLLKSESESLRSNIAEAESAVKSSSGTTENGINCLEQEHPNNSGFSGVAMKDGSLADSAVEVQSANPNLGHENPEDPSQPDNSDDQKGNDGVLLRRDADEESGNQNLFQFTRDCRESSEDEKKNKVKIEFADKNSNVIDDISEKIEKRERETNDEKSSSAETVKKNAESDQSAKRSADIVPTSEESRLNSVSSPCHGLEAQSVNKFFENKKHSVKSKSLKDEKEIEESSRYKETANEIHKDSIVGEDHVSKNEPHMGMTSKPEVEARSEGIIKTLESNKSSDSVFGNENELLSKTDCVIEDAKKTVEDNSTQLKTTVPLDDLQSDSFGFDNNNDDNQTSNEDLYYGTTTVSDHDYSNLTESVENDSCVPIVSDGKCEKDVSSLKEDLLKSEDNLRDVIRMQLSSLRNMKKSNQYLPDLKNKSALFQNIKKKRKSCDIHLMTSLADSKGKVKEKNNDCTNHTAKTFAVSTKDVEVENKICNKKITRNERDEHIMHDENMLVEEGNNKIEDDILETNRVVDEIDNSSCSNSSLTDVLVSLSDETSFVILNVTGGVDELPCEADVPKETNSTIVEQKSEDSNAESSKDSSGVPSRRQIKDIITGSKRKRHDDTSSNKEEIVAGLTVKRNISENFSDDPGIKKSVKNSEKSPFVSDSLEDFLNESSQLKISYSIPKLRAEEGITENSKKCPYSDGKENSVVSRKPKIDVGIEQEPSPQKEKPKLVKAKTLAEMRRNLEKMKAKEKTAPSSLTKPEQMNAEEDKLGIDTSMITASPNNIFNRNCFLMYDNRKIFLTGNVNDKCIVAINTKYEKDILRGGTVTSFSTNAKQKTPKKQSLLSSLTGNERCKLRYKPGPLCRKVDLQNNESRSKWMTELKTLPKVFLEVTPEVKKMVDPKIAHLLPIFDDPIITEERTEFALSVLQTKDNNNNEPKSFNFHIPYNNKQEMLLVRRPCKSATPKDTVDYKEADPEKEIGAVLDALITYVETKEIEDTLIKEDDPIEEDVNYSINKSRGRKTKRKRLEYELLRLSCKVINVASTENVNVNCSKPHCRLGCVCKSLLCESVFSNHCQLVECMFHCKCPQTSSDASKASTSFLSAHTVNHLEDKAKKNLAKVEREFTQTFIHTDNDIIFVGSGKIRRSSRPPKKYNDYIANDAVFEDLSAPSSLPLKDCSVVVRKMALGDIKPYCLCHNLHDCYCKGEAVDLTPAKRSHRSEAVEHTPPKKLKIGNDISKIRIMRARDEPTKLCPESCARIRKVFPEYRKRNKDPIYNKRLRIKNFNLYLQENNSQKIELLSLNNKEFQSVRKSNKRKQSFEIRQDFPSNFPDSRSNKEFALQRRKKRAKPSIFAKGKSKKTATERTTCSIFDGEIRVSLKDNEEILNIIGKANAGTLEYLRILPWAKLIEGYRLRKINIWARKKLSSVLLCNGAGYFPPKHFVDIKCVEYKSEIINWILTDTLPSDRPRELMHLILTPKQTHFLIAGYCLKKIKETPESEESVSDQNSTAFDVEENRGIEECASPKRSESRSSIEDAILEDEDETEVETRQIDQNAELSGCNLFSLSFEQQKQRTYQEAISDNNIHEESSITLLQPYEETIIQPLIPTNDVSDCESIVPLIETPKRTIQLVEFPSNEVPVLQSTRGERSRYRFFYKSTKIYEKMNSDESKVSESKDITTISRGNVKNSTTLARTKVSSKSNISQESTLLSKQLSLEQSKENLSLSSTRQSLKMKSILNPVVSRSNINPAVSVPPKLSSSSAADDKRKTSPDRSTPPSSSEIRYIKNFKRTNANLSSPASQQRSVMPIRSLKCTHKDMLNKSKTLVLTQKEFPKRKLYFKKHDERCNLAIALPKVSKKFKWWMIYLNSDFTFLNFIKANYSIKYTDLMDVVKMSSNIGSTITLRNKEFSDQYKHPIFGIFCVPEYQDRLFIGPYLPSEKHQTETLRYLQGRLIHTQTFNKMVGRNGNGKSPTWVFEAPICVFQPISLPNGLIIDITAEDGEEHCEPNVVNIDSDESDDMNYENSFLCPPFVEMLSPAELLLKRGVNRYIMTNIPHLGYFEARQRDTKCIEVFWPNGSRGYRFPNVTFAKNVLIQYLSHILCPIPATFKINVIIMTHLDMQTNKPVNPKYLSGNRTYFCGEFGIFEKNEVTAELLAEYETKTMDFLLESHKKFRESEVGLVKLFGLFVMSNEELRKHTDPHGILQWAVSEIYILKKLSENYESEKTDLQNMIRLNSLKIKKCRNQNLAQTSVRTKRGSDTIEIVDSDEDALPRESEREEVCGFKRISVSGRVKHGQFTVESDDRSLLKPKISLKSELSLLKTTESQKEDSCLTADNLTETSVRNSDIVLNKNKSITK